MSPQSSGTLLTQAPATNGSVISGDGTRIGYRQIGHGPGLVVLHGAMETARSHQHLAEALAPHFTVYLPDRRGRGLSGPHGEDYTVQRHIEDVDALLRHTAAHFVFGVSAGGIIALQAACTLPAIHKLAVYEPAMVSDDNLSRTVLPRLDRELAHGQIEAALVTGMLGAQMGPPFMQRMPRWLLTRLTGMMLKAEEKKAPADTVTMRQLAPTLHDDFQIVAELSKNLPGFAAIEIEVLLLGGSKSPRYLQQALDTLARTLPHATRHEFAGLDHSASGNRDQRGHPEVVALALQRFFTTAPHA
ncbi:MAG: alpha/beta hydrolase [Ktedonobacterales bacterium]|nr:alpha/beta hydrolase [Ktedonobacterales bacterium]